MQIFGTDVDFNSNEAKQFRVENLLGFPTVSASDVGRIFSHTGQKTFYGWNGVAWLDLALAGGGGSYVLPTATTTILGGVKIDGSTITIDGNGVISSSSGSTPSGLEAVNEGNGIGYRLIGKVASGFATAGLDSVDFGTFGSKVGQGASGEYSFNHGEDNIAGAYGSTTFGYNHNNTGVLSTLLGEQNETNTYSSLINGYNVKILGGGNRGYGFATGRGHELTGGFANAAIGTALKQTNGVGVILLGHGNEDIATATTNTTTPTNPVLIVGNGTHEILPLGDWTDAVRSNALVIRNSGNFEMPTYGKGVVTGLPEYSAAWDVNGNLIEIELPFTGDIKDIDSTQIFNIGDIGTQTIEAGFNAFTFAEDVQAQADGYVLINSIMDGLVTQHLFVGVGGAYGTTGTLTALPEDFTLVESTTLIDDVWRNRTGTQTAYGYSDWIRHKGRVVFDDVIHCGNKIESKDGQAGGKVLIGGNYGADFVGGNLNYSLYRFAMGGVVTQFAGTKSTGSVQMIRNFSFVAGSGDMHATELLIGSTVDFTNANDAGSTYKGLYINPNVTNAGAARVHAILSETGDIEFRNGKVILADLPVHADEASAVTAGLLQHEVYKTATGEIRIKL